MTHSRAPRAHTPRSSGCVPSDVRDSPATHARAWPHVRAMPMRQGAETRSTPACASTSTASRPHQPPNPGASHCRAHAAKPGRVAGEIRTSDGTQRWIEAYERAARDYASCRFIEDVGSGAMAPDAKAVQVLHDELPGNGEAPIADGSPCGCLGVGAKVRRHLHPDRGMTRGRFCSEKGYRPLFVP